jgi:hypothetical protein
MALLRRFFFDALDRFMLLLKVRFFFVLLRRSCLLLFAREGLFFIARRRLQADFTREFVAALFGLSSGFAATRDSEHGDEREGSETCGSHDPPLPSLWHSLMIASSAEAG